MILAILFLIVALLAVVSVFRQLKFKNYLALVFALLTAASFGFFSVMTITCELTSLPICG